MSGFNLATIQQLAANPSPQSFEALGSAGAGLPAFPGLPSLPSAADLLKDITGVATQIGTVAGGGPLTLPGGITIPTPTSIANSVESSVSGAITATEAFGVRMGIFVFLIIMLLIGLFAVIVPAGDVQTIVQNTGKKGAELAPVLAE